MIENYAHAAHLQGVNNPEPISIRTEERTAVYAAGKGDFDGTTINWVVFRFIEEEDDNGDFDLADENIQILSMWDSEEKRLPECSILKAWAKRDILKSMRKWYPSQRPYPSEDEWVAEIPEAVQ